MCKLVLPTYCYVEFWALLKVDTRWISTRSIRNGKTLFTCYLLIYLSGQHSFAPVLGWTNLKACPVGLALYNNGDPTQGKSKMSTSEVSVQHGKSLFPYRLHIYSSIYRSTKIVDHYTPIHLDPGSSPKTQSPLKKKQNGKKTPDGSLHLRWIPDGEEFWDL